MKEEAPVPEMMQIARVRGRPRVAGEELNRRQQSVLMATGRLLAGRRSSDITIDQVIAEAGTSKPTFYRWFPGGMEQVLDMLISQANASLMASILVAIGRSHTAEDRIRAGAKAYFDWGIAMGPVAQGIYREGFYEGSVPYRYRRQTVGAVITLLEQQAISLGMTSISPRAIETLVSWIEAAGAVLLRDYPVSREAAEQQCRMTSEMVIAMLQVFRSNAL